MKASINIRKVNNRDLSTFRHNADKFSVFIFTVTLAPFSGVLSSWIKPPCFSESILHMDKPIPK